MSHLDVPTNASNAKRDAGAERERLFAALYAELHRVAKRELRRNAAVPVSATTLLHETYLSMSRNAAGSFPDRARFMAYAACAMRGVLIDSFSELDAVEVPLGEGVGGMESSGLVLMETGPYEAVRWLDERADASVPPVFMLMVTAAHETAHQWWYGMVGSDPYLSPWLDESLTNWSGNFWMEQEGGPSAGGMAFGLCLAGSDAQAHIGQAMTGVVADYGSFPAYAEVIYARGALFYQWLRRRMGEERFFAFLRAWSGERRWTQATPEQWRATLARFAGPELVAEAEERWLAGTGLTDADLHAGAMPFTPTANRP